VNPLIKPLVVAVVLYAPVASFAQPNRRLTHSDVRAQLVQIEQAGSNMDVGAKDPDYPADFQAAEGRDAAGNRSTTSVGGAQSGLYGSGTH